LNIIKITNEISKKSVSSKLFESHLLLLIFWCR